MFKVLRPTKDAYITNRVIDASVMSGSNVGGAGSLDLFKVLGLATTSSIELSRLLVQFDMSPLRSLVTLGSIDPGHPSFSCRLHLSDVYGGQPTPSNFTVAVYPLSASFDEGIGRDVVLYSDTDVCNWMSGSHATGSWHAAGCANGGYASSSCDYITSSSLVSNLKTTQLFIDGTEDLDVDITSIVSGTLAGSLPDVGLRISFDSSLEGDQYTYFVKRFASRTAFNEDLRPKIFVRFDDSIQDDTNNVYMDATNYLFLHNYVRSVPSSLVSGSSTVTGKNCLVLDLTTPVSGGQYTLHFTGSQHYKGIFPTNGVYSASILIPSNDPVLLSQWQTSGSITFTPIWRSFDNTVTYLSGSTITAYMPQRGSRAIDPQVLEVSVLGVPVALNSSEQRVLRVNIFDRSSPYVINAVRLPVELPGAVVRDVFYQVRDLNTARIAIPFDTVTNSTRVSSDSSGMYFKLDASALTPGHSYVVDVLVVTGDEQRLYRSASAAFRVDVT